jgi:hypothetical protein
MSSASPSILTSVEEFQNFTQSISVEDPGISGPVPATVTGVTANLSTEGLTINYSGSNVTISGRYVNIFTEKTFEYLVTEPQEEVTVTSYQDIPSKIYALTQFNPSKILSKTITYTISTTSGSASVSQTIQNNWDTGKSQMLQALSRVSV